MNPEIPHFKAGEDEADEVDMLDGDTVPLRFAGGIKSAEEQYGVEDGWDLESGNLANGKYEAEDQPKSARALWTLRWRDHLVRAGLVLAMVLTVGGIVWWISENPSGYEDTTDASGTAAAATATAKAAASARF